MKEVKREATREFKSKPRTKDFPIAPDTKAAIRIKRNLHKLLRINKDRINNDPLREEVKAANKNLKQLLRRDKIRSFEEKLSRIENERNTTIKWKKMKEIMQINKTDNAPISHLTKPDGSITSSLKEIVDVHIERLYETHRPKEADPDMSDWEKSLDEEITSNHSKLNPLAELTREADDELLDEFFRLDKIKEKISKLKKRSAAGEDGINNIFIQNLPEKLIEALKKIFDLCVASGYFPASWKRARIKMLLKPGRDKKASGNYRPISLLSNIAKLFESLIKDAVDAFSEKLKLLPETHSGFRKGRSTQENFVRLSESVAASFKSKKITVGAFIDLERAFDGLHHNSIRSKLLKTGLPAKITRLISSFLRKRIIYVQEGETKSKEMEMLGGCPQGAILSPTIFNIFTADAPLRNDDEEGAAIFADDTSCWTTTDSLDTSIMLLQRRLRLLESWGRKWRLVPAPTKSHVICFSRQKRTRERARNFSIELMDSTVNWTEEVRFLGVTYDSQLSFKPHVDKLIQRCVPKAQAICKLTKFGRKANPTLIINLFNSLILSNFTYGSPAYVGMSELNWNKVDSFFSKSLKCAFGLPRNSRNLSVLNYYYGGRISSEIKDITGKRVHDIFASVPIVSDIIPRIAENLLNRPHCSPVEKLIAHSNCCSFGDCLMCYIGIPHDCVKNLMAYV